MLLRIQVFFAVILILLTNSCKENQQHPEPAAILEIRGADLSFTPEIEGAGVTFFDSQGEEKDLLAIFKEAGCNTIRLRLWHTPHNSHSGLEEVEGFARRLKGLGFKIWLDLHYSDTWADPGQQTKPVAWENLAFEQLQDSVLAYTKMVMGKFNPEYVQIGNEINNGLLWEEGRRTNQQQYISLLRSGIKAVRESNPDTKIIVHYAGIDGANTFYSLLQENSVDYDIIGLSFYPFWHGKDLEALNLSIVNLMKVFQKQLVLAEIAYPFTLGWNDYTNNIIGDKSQIIDPYPPTPGGQESYLEAIRDILLSNTSVGTLGFCYWAPDWVAFRGPTAVNGSAWENQALFDFNNKAVPGMDVFRK